MSFMWWKYLLELEISIQIPYGMYMAVSAYILVNWNTIVSEMLNFLK